MKLQVKEIVGYEVLYCKFRLLLLTQVLSPAVESEGDPLHVGPSPGGVPHPPDSGTYMHGES